MLKIRTRLLSVILLVAVLLSFTTVSASAAGSTTDWQTAYTNFILSDKFPKEEYASAPNDYRPTSMFSLCDIDMDGIPELFASKGSPNPRVHVLELYTYNKGIVDVGEIGNGWALSVDSAYYGFITHFWNFPTIGTFSYGFEPYENGKLGEYVRLLSEEFGYDIDSDKSIVKNEEYANHELAKLLKNGTLKARGMPNWYDATRANVTKAIQEYKSSVTPITFKNGVVAPNVTAVQLQNIICLNWGAVQNAKYAVYYVSQDSVTKAFSAWSVNATTDTSFTIPNVTENATYYITILPYTDTPSRQYGGFSLYTQVRT